MKILVSATHGQVGSALLPFLTARRHEVWSLLRQPKDLESNPRSLLWDPAAGTIDREKLEGFDAVIHLGGTNLASQRWNEDFKKELKESRVGSTGLLARALASLSKKPKVFLCASAVGIYGDRDDEELSEKSAPGEGFLASLCQEWEAALAPAASSGIRIVNLRFGVILSTSGGVLKKMLLPFKLGLGGRIGSGAQSISWISLPDLLLALAFLTESEKAEGPYNLATANPVSNRNFTKALARAVGMPALFPLPAFAARLILGEMADELLLSSQRALPVRLKEAGFKFQLPYIGEALARLIPPK